MANYLDNDIKFVAGVGEARARLLEKELGIRTLGDMLCHYPFRYIDRTRIYRIDQIAEGDSALIQFRGRITGVSYAGAGRKRRFTAVVNDGSGVAELVWFQGIKWIEKRIEVGREYLIFGRPSFFKGELSVVHPEIETIEKAFSARPKAVCKAFTPRPSGFRASSAPKASTRSSATSGRWCGIISAKRCPTECGPGTACCRCAMRSTTSISRNRPNCCGRRNTG